MNSWLRYFARPIPGRSGFSAYRMPGLAFHLSFLLGLALVGWALCFSGAFAVTRLLLVAWIVAGLYGGRDLAILAHYNPLLILAWLGGLIAAMVPDVPGAALGAIQAFARAHDPEAPIAFTAALLAGFALWVRWWIRDDAAP